MNMEEFYDNLRYYKSLINNDRKSTDDWNVLFENKYVMDDVKRHHENKTILNFISPNKGFDGSVPSVLFVLL
jgi:hypothetical protein